MAVSIRQLIRMFCLFYLLKNRDFTQNSSGERGCCFTAAA
jgi:hypothetical protein